MRCGRAGYRIVMAMRTQLARMIRLMLPAGNPVSRGVDRVEGYSLRCVVLLGIVLVPIMLVVGSVTYADVVAQSEQQTRTRYQVVATLLEDAPRGVVGATAEGGTDASRVPARWRPPSGAPRTGRVHADDGLVAGARVRIWVDPDGEPVSPPITSADAVIAGVVIAATGWFTAAVVLWLTHVGIKRLLDRRRMRAWGREWARVEPGWRADSN
jgi:hypothetical protein